MAFTILITLCLLFLPTDAQAWGIGVHLQIGSYVLEHLGRLPASLQAILSGHTYDFLYGCISADITLGKKFTHHLRHCHSWRIGKKILEAADSDRQRACAYGYLVHLAADTVAHSYFVPVKMIRSYNTALLNHAYWEVRVEACVDAKSWLLARQIAQKNFSVNDAMMRRVLSNTLFSFATNKRIFNSLLLLNRLQHWQKMIRSMATRSRWTLPEENLAEYLSLASDAALNLLAVPDSPSWQADPTGEKALLAARIIRKNLKLLLLHGKIDPKETDTYLLGLRPKFRDCINRPEALFEQLSLED
jgi:hypothetical protein